MNTLEDALHYPWGTALPATGGSVEIAPGVRWLRMGLPFALDHINLWLLRDEVDGRSGWSAVDTCVDRAEARAQWEQVIAGEMGELPIVRLLATHMHPDHLGLAHWLCERFDARLWISMSDYLMAQLAVNRQDSFGGQATADFFARHGVLGAQVLATVVERKDYYARMVPAVPAHYRRLQDGQRLTIGGRPWRCISGYGHSPEHMALFCDDASLPQPVLISGDMVLPRISTNTASTKRSLRATPCNCFWTRSRSFWRCPSKPWCCPRMDGLLPACTSGYANSRCTTRNGWTRSCAPAATNRSAPPRSWA
jgi:glyoxylase-like metal-dependent hydrolase (beta-lactamase superfamily II)